MNNIEKEMKELNEMLKSMNSIFGKSSKYGLSDKERKQIVSIGTMFENFQIPYRIPNFFKNNMSMEISMLREPMIAMQGFVLVTWKLANALAEWIGSRRCLEVMAGTGVLSYALQKKGIDIVATDNYSWDANKGWYTNKRTYTEVENLDAIEALDKYNDVDIVIMSWAYMDDTAYRVLQKMRKVNPSMIMLVIGEGDGGCTADTNFFESIVEIEDPTFRKVQKEFYQFHGLHDFPELVK